MSNTEHTGGVKTIEEVLSDLADNIATLCSKYRHREISFDEAITHSSGYQEEAKDKLEALMQDKVIEARIDVLKRLPTVRTNFSNFSIDDVVLKTQIDRRITELEQLRTTN